MLHDIEQLNERIDESVNTNGQRAITGVILNHTLKDIAETLGQGRSYAGQIYPSSAEPDHNDAVFYIATEKGTYLQDAQFPVVIDRDGVYIVYWNYYIGKWMCSSVIYDNSVLAVLSTQELTGHYIGDANHDLLADNNKIRGILSIRGRVYYYSEYTSSDDVYVSLPVYDGDVAELSFYAMYVKRARSSSVGGYPYHIKKLTIGGVVETDV
jgi:hypothetical protein